MLEESNSADATTRLHSAIETGDHGAIIDAVIAGADLAQWNSQGYCALTYAAIWGDVKAAELLLARGADVDSRTVYGVTALMCAAISGSKEMIQLLLRRGADPSLRSDNGMNFDDFLKENENSAR